MKKLCLLIPFLLVGCTTLPGIVSERAAYDFKCDKNSVAVANITMGTYEASGCEKKAVYNCVLNRDSATCVLERYVEPNSHELTKK